MKVRSARKQGPWVRAWALLALGLSACGAPPPRARVEPPAPPPPAEDVQICLGTIEQRGIMLCRGPIDEETARHTELSYRLYRRHGLPFRIDRVNGWGRLVEGDDGTASTEITYGVLPPVQETERDAKGRIRFRVRYSEHLVRTDVTGEGGRPVIGLEGTFPTNLRTFDDRGFVAQTRYFDPLGDPTWDQRDLAFGHRFTRNERGILVAMEALGKHTETLVSTETCSLIKWEVDDLGRDGSMSCFTIDGAPALGPGGFHAARYRRDRWGNRIGTRFVDRDGRPTPGRSGFAGIQRILGDHGEELERVYLGTNSQPIDSTRGLATERARYDELGRRIEARYFHADGTPAHVRHEAWGARLGYDDHDRRVEKTFLDGEGHPVAEEGTATIRQAWSDDGHVVQRDYFDAEGKPVAAPIDEATCGICEGPVTTEVYQSLLGAMTAAQGCTDVTPAEKSSAKKATVRVRIGKDGTACFVGFVDDTSDYPELAACMQRRFEKAKYRSPGPSCVEMKAEMKLRRAK